jgi:hypothetical protein
VQLVDHLLVQTRTGLSDRKSDEKHFFENQHHEPDGLFAYPITAGFAVTNSRS